MTVVMWIVLWILWTVIVLIAGYYSGWVNGKSAPTRGDVGEPGITGPQGPVGVSGKDGEPGPPGPPGKTPDADDLIVDKDLNLTLSEWMVMVNSRLTRVERKAGMSV